MHMNLVVLLITLAISLVVQFYLTLIFIGKIKRFAVPLLHDIDLPHAVVILCLRGGDPFLSRCIAGLVTQNYPRFKVCFMIDHPADPSVDVLRAALAEQDFTNYEIRALQNPLATCSLKCSSLVQAIEGLGDDVHFVALLDADVVPHADWLRELATALHPAEIGAATGNRWYMPVRHSTGAMVRHVWNAAAVVQMYWYEIAWGGTVAIKLESIRRAKLLDRWRSALCEDTMLRSQLGKIGQRVAFVPSLMMVNREDCSLLYFVSWVRRQLLTTKLYHPLWLAVVGHGVLSALHQLWGWGSCAVYLLRGDGLQGLVAGGAMLGFQASLILMLPWLESAVASIVRARGEPADWRRSLSWLKLVATVGITQWAYTWALLSTLSVRIVQWRGIAYRTRGPWDIRMQAYQPYQDSAEATDADAQSL